MRCRSMKDELAARAYNAPAADHIKKENTNVGADKGKAATIKKPEADKSIQGVGKLSGDTGDGSASVGKEGVLDKESKESVKQSGTTDPAKKGNG